MTMLYTITTVIELVQYYKQKGTGERLLKTQGTSKLDTYCTASIRTTSNQLTKEMEVEVCNTHYGHLSEMEHYAYLKM